MTNFEVMNRAILLDPWNDLARLAYRDAWMEAGFRSEPEHVGKLVVKLYKFMKYARKWFKHHPITEVVLTDRKPWSLPPNGCCWHLDDGSWQVNPEDAERHTASLLPASLFHLLESRLPHSRCGGWAHYPTSEGALSSLSAACVAYGREVAGLPALPPRPCQV